ncbi:MAG: radical SAM protein [Eubacteriales bacterium]|nr:radical SAM protein [Eubacteriales bacterium]
MSLYDEILKSENRSVDFPEILNKITVEKGFLTNCTIELTPLCNFKCKFCYARKSPEQLKQNGEKVFSFDDWKRYIDELAQMNCMTLVLTGGECTIHPEFVKIYRYAYEKGFVITVFTNGSNITDEILSTFVEYPPSRIFVTMYGASSKTYETVTGHAKWFEIVKRNIEKMVDKKLDLIIQNTMSSENIKDTEDLYDYANSLSLEFRYSSMLNSYGNCTEEVYEQVKADNDLAQEVSNNIWRKQRGMTQQQYIEHINTIHTSFVPKKSDPNAVGIKCSAGRNACFFAYNGYMQVCNTFDVCKIDTKNKTIRECFEQLIQWANSLPRIKECEDCIHAFHCNSCAALHYNDTGKLGVPSPKICFKILEPEKAKIEQEYFDKYGCVDTNLFRK